MIKLTLFIYRLLLDDLSSPSFDNGTVYIESTKAKYNFFLYNEESTNPNVTNLISTDVHSVEIGMCVISNATSHSIVLLIDNFITFNFTFFLHNWFVFTVSVSQSGMMCLFLNKTGPSIIDIQLAISSSLQEDVTLALSNVRLTILLKTT